MVLPADGSGQVFPGPGELAAGARAGWISAAVRAALPFDGGEEYKGKGNGSSSNGNGNSSGNGNSNGSGNGSGNGNSNGKACRGGGCCFPP